MELQITMPKDLARSLLKSYELAFEDCIARHDELYYKMMPTENDRLPQLQSIIKSLHPNDYRTLSHLRKEALKILNTLERLKAYVES